MCEAHCQPAIYEVSAGPRARQQVLVSAPCRSSGGCGCHGRAAHAHLIYELDDAGRRRAPLPAQCVPEADGWRIYWLVPALEAGQVRRYELSAEQAAAAELGGGVTVNCVPGQQADFRMDGELVTSYVVKPDIARPYCYPVYGPGGVPMTNFAPPDHPHHKSMYVAQGALNGHDNWSELEGHARTVNTGLRVVAEGPLLAALEATGDWVSARGEKLMQEVVRLTLYRVGPEARLMDWAITWRAAYQGVHIGDTKEAGTLAVRVAESMEERRGGRIVNAYGAVGEEECWGRRAPWVDYSGPVDDQLVGLAIFDHPANFRHPTYWHVRSYGLFTANQWGVHDFTGDWARRGDHTLPRGHQLTFNLRVYLHRGDVDRAQVAAKYLDYAYPPKVRVVEE
jgi:hypothetical protein